MPDAVRDYTRERFVEMFLAQSSRAQLGLMAAAALLALMWHLREGDGRALAWLLVAAGVTAWRHGATTRFVLREPVRGAPERIALLLFVNGVLMAVPLSGFVRFSEVERAAVSIVLLGAAAASTATTSGYRAIFLAFAVPMLVPLAFAWAMVPGDGPGIAARRVGVAALVLAFLVFLLGIARQVQNAFEQASRFRFGELQLNRELKAALDAASDANRAKTQFLAAASHDLRQPIHSINVLIAALSLRQLDTRSREIVALLESVTASLSQQLDGLLDISKLDAGIVTPALSPVQLRPLLHAHHAALQPLAQGRGLTLSLGRIDSVLVRTDAALWQRVLSNLTDNALKFTPRGGFVKLELVQQQGRAVLTVSDTGIGISEHEQRHVFREFYQVGNRERDRSRGLGLGLSIVQRLSGLLGIELKLHSAPGAGTTVTLTMPVLGDDGPAADAPPKPAPASPRGKVVLVVDDEAMARDSMKLLLDELGCVVQLASSTDEALALAMQQPPDLVLSDFRLREGDDGLRVLQTLRRSRPGLRAALVTGDTAPERLRDAQAAGVLLLHKPVTLSGLLALLGPAPGGAKDSS